MVTRGLPGTHALTAALLVTGLAGCTDGRTPTTPDSDGVAGLASLRSAPAEVEPFTVYDQNAFLGGDTGPLFSTDLSDILAVLTTTHTFWAQVTQNDAPERMAAIVNEIEAARPQLVSLEEVFQMAVVDATDGRVLESADLLPLILGEIQARDLPYELVRDKKLTSVTLPLEVDFTATPSPKVVKVVVVTDRIAALRRTDVDVLAATDGTYAASIPLTPDIDVIRGWIRVDLERNGVPYHVFTTHLEGQFAAPVQAAQAAELTTSVAAGLDGVTLLVGDFNSDASGGPDDPAWTPTYQTLLDAGFTDAWAQAGWPAHDPGYTCCHDTALRDDGSTFDQRLDLVMVKDARNRSRSGLLSGSATFRILGTSEGDRTSTHGLWMSDHAGVLAGLRLAKR